MQQWEPGHAECCRGRGELPAPAGERGPCRPAPDTELLSPNRTPTLRQQRGSAMWSRSGEPDRDPATGTLRAVTNPLPGCLSAGRARRDAAASRRSVVHVRPHRPTAPHGGTPAPDMDGAAGSSARPQPLRQQPNQAPNVAENRWKPQQEEMQRCRESGQELADVAAPPQHTQSRGATRGCHITPSTHTSTRRHQRRVPSAGQHQHCSHSAQPPWDPSPTPPDPFPVAGIARYSLGKEVPGADNELEDVLQGLEGAHERLAGLSTARLLHVLRQHRDQLPAGQGHRGGSAASLPHGPGLSPLPAHPPSLSPSLLAPAVLVGERGAEVLADVSLQDGVEVVKLPISHEPHDENLRRGRRAWHGAAKAQSSAGKQDSAYQGIKDERIIDIRVCILHHDGEQGVQSVLEELGRGEDCEGSSTRS